MQLLIRTFVRFLCLSTTAGVFAQTPVFTTNLPPTKQMFAGFAEFNYLEVFVTGAAPLSYQWYKNGALLPNATSSSLYTVTGVRAVTLADAGTYTVVVTSSAGSATSVASVVSIGAPLLPPTIPGQPVSTTTVPGSQASFSATATNVEGLPMVYQWFKDIVNPIPGATTNTLTLANVSAADAGRYHLQVDYAPAVSPSFKYSSQVVTLTVAAAPSSSVAPVIAIQPVPRAALAGSSVSFTVTATGTPAPSYQWQKNNVPLNGAQGTTLTLNNLRLADAGVYSVVVANNAGAVTSDSATLAVLTAPLSQSVAAGHNVTLAAGTGASFQWQVSTDGGANWSNLADGMNYTGTRTANLTIVGATADMTGYRYRYTATLNGVTTASDASALLVTPVFFPHPAAVTTDATGNVFVGDALRNTIVRVDATGRVTRLAGVENVAGTADGSGLAAQFNQPRGLVLGSDGSLYVADAGNGTVRRISSAGVVTTLAGSPTNRGSRDGAGGDAWFSSPAGVTIDPSGALYVADPMSHTIRRISASGAVNTFAGAAGQSGAVDGPAASARFNNPSGVAADAAGNIYVADTYNNLVRKITPAGQVSTVAGLEGVAGATDGPGADALFNQPTALAIDSAGNIYVADTANSTIRKITPSGSVTTLAGLAAFAGFRDGSGSGAWFNQPKAVAVDRAGRVYVADAGNAALRVISAEGVVSTLVVTTQAAEAPPVVPVSPPTVSAPPAGTNGGSSSGGGGGGALSGTFLFALANLAAIRLAWLRHARRRAAA